LQFWLQFTLAQRVALMEALTLKDGVASSEVRLIL
jgi:hypothetical protein